MCIRDRYMGTLKTRKNQTQKIRQDMPLFDEVWDDNDFTYRQRVNLKTLPANHLVRLKNLKFDFVEYKANHLFACHLYERMMLLCFNQYGVLHEAQKIECLDATNFFELCLKNNAAFGFQKKYWPELFATNPYARPTPNFEQVYVGKFQAPFAMHLRNI
eukprot:TRINITY_DN102_c0_g1_i1.p1 TRINITY_DN102_c0_g1~~TRINITY_DN102_c0_g1_i1.p1  ORF type:complete len:180 (+),score=68.51 TRINITY_DN102_c0_g1_i1:64-540(+)